MLLAQMPAVFRCPSARFAERALPESYCTDYFAIACAEAADEPSIGTAWPDKTPTRFRDFQDGTSNVILLAESNSETVLWMEPRDLRLAELPMAINHAERGGISSYHPGGCHIALADGSIRYLSQTVRPGTLRKLLLRNDGEAVGKY